MQIISVKKFKGFVQNITFFSKTADGLYSRFEERHYQRAYSVKQIKMLLEHAGLSVLEVLGEDMKTAPDKKSERVYFVVKN